MTKKPPSNFDQANSIPTEQPVKAFDASQDIKTHFRTCNLCEAMCGIKIDYQGERVIKVSGDENDKHSNGYICPKGFAIKDLHNDPDRLKTPLKRVGDQWIAIDWDEAFDEVASRLVAIQEQHGDDSVAAYWGNPTAHNLGLILALHPFRKALNSKNMHTGSSVDQLPHMVNSYLMFGSSFLFSIPDIDRTDYMLMIGANPAASNGSLMSAGDVKTRLKAIEKRGGKLVVIDPRYTETAKFATDHHFIEPATDAMLLCGLIQVIFNEDLVADASHLPLKGHLADIKALVSQFSLPRIASVTGIDTEQITRIAREFAAAKRAVCYGRFGMSVQAFGGFNHYLMQVLNIITGNLDRPGGMMFTTPAADLLSVVENDGYDRYRSRVHNMPETFGEFPIAHLPDEILTPGPGQVKAFVCTAANPVLSSPNGPKVEKALRSLDLMVSVDFYLNETSRLADIILPPTGPFEHEQYDLIFNMLAVRNVAKFSPPLFKQKRYMRSDYEIYQAITDRITRLKAKSNPVKKLKSVVMGELGSRLTPERVIDLMLRFGPYGSGLKGLVPGLNDGLSLKLLKKNKHGIDLGALEPRIKDVLKTSDKRIDLLPKQMREEFSRLKTHFPDSYKHESLTLISRRDLRTNNSWLHNSPILMKGKNRCTLLVHPTTADQLSILDGERVNLISRVGKIPVEVSLSDTVKPNVVCLPHGWGHDRNGTKLSIAQKTPGVSINDVTDELASDPLTGTAAFSSVKVELEKIRL